MRGLDTTSASIQKSQAVPDKNSTGNVSVRDVVGNREDKSFSDAAAHPSLAGALKAGYYHVHDKAKVWPSGYGAITSIEASPVAGGTGYEEGDVVLTVVQEGASGGTVTATVNSSGVVTGVVLLTAGTGYRVESPLETVYDGDGEGCTIDVDGSDFDLGKDPVELTAGASAWLHGNKIEVVPADKIGAWFDIHWLVASNVSAADDYEVRVYAGAALSEIEIGRVSFTRNAANDRSATYVPIQVPPQPGNTRISMSLACKSADARTCEVKIYYHTYPDMTVE